MTRGPGAGEHGPSSGYRYDGIYFVEQWWEGTDPDSGVRIFLYRLRKDPEGGREKSDGGPPGGPTEERYSTVQRLVRNTAVTEWVKKAHRHRCQVCGIELVTPGGNYAEGAHIRPRGRPHSGPDEASNVLCLCPNHHVLFNRGAIYVNADLEIVERASDEIRGKLRIVKGHDPSLTQLAYHRALFDRGKK